MTLTRHASAAAAAALLLLTTDACSSTSASTSTAGRLQIVTTVAPITSIVATIAGDKADVRGVVPEGTNSHTFEPPPSAAEVLSKADLVFINGLKLEDPTRELANQNLKKGAEVVEIATSILPESEQIYDFSFPKKDGKPNPHLWTDPLLAIKYAQVAADSLEKHDPANKDYYAKNLTAFTTQATALSDALKHDQETIPGGKKELLTYHDAYAYFGRDYGWKIIGAVQPSNFEDPTPKEIVSLIEQIKAEKVPVIFGSEVFPSKVLEEIAKDSGARYEDTLRDDDLPGKPGEPEHSWVGLMRYDFRTMVSALGGTTTMLDAVDTSSVAPDKADYPQ